MKSLLSNLVHLAEDEGRQTALNIAQSLQDALETIAEAGDETEVAVAVLLLHRVNASIEALLLL